MRGEKRETIVIGRRVIPTAASGGGAEGGEEVRLDLGALVASRLLIQARSGGGKSWLLRLILERLHGLIQELVIDPEGEFASLREQYDYVIGGRGGDVGADPATAAVLARRLLELRVSAVLDLYELRPSARQQFVRRFCEALVDAPARCGIRR